MEKRDRFIRLAVVEQKTYDTIAQELGVERKQLSEWWEECHEERKRIELIRKLYNRKQFKKTKFPEFYNWYLSKEKKCFYCGTTEDDIAGLIWCNNAKSDEFTSEEFKPIGREIGRIMRRRLRRER